MVQTDRLQMAIWHMCIVCCIRLKTHSEYNIYFVFHGNRDYMNVPQCYIHIYIVLLNFCYSFIYGKISYALL